MTNVNEIETEILESMVWDCNLNLREKLIQMRFNPPTDTVNYEALHKEIETHMRVLDEYQTCLYLREIQGEEDYFSSAQDPYDLSNKLLKYFEWRVDHLGRFGDMASNRSPIKGKLKQLYLDDHDKCVKLFGTDLYKQSDFINHWSIVLTYDSNGKRYLKPDQIHSDIQLVDTIAFYKSGFSTSFFQGGSVLHDDQVLTERSEGFVTGVFKTYSHSHPEPCVTITPIGGVKYDFTQ